MNRRDTLVHENVLGPRLLVWLTAASVTAIQFGVMGSSWCVILGVVGSLSGALGMRRLTPGLFRLQAAVLLGFSATWLGMWATTHHYADLDPVRDRAALIRWQYELGTRGSNPDDDAVTIAPVAAGFPTWGVGGGDAYGLDLAKRHDFLGPVLLQRSTFESLMPNGPACLSLRFGLWILWVNWIVLTLASGLALALVPDRCLRHAPAVCLALHGIGLASFVTWFGAHCLH